VWGDARRVALVPAVNTATCKTTHTCATVTLYPLPHHKETYYVCGIMYNKPLSQDSQAAGEFSVIPYFRRMATNQGSG
jgi:hypothetical protein